MMRFVRFRELAAWGLLSLVAFAGDSAALESEPATTPHSTVRLVMPTTGSSPGTPLRLGIHFTLKPGWHIYWLNPGESGEAPKLRWTLPPGYEAGPVEWPIPIRIPTKSVVSFGYDGEPLLGTPLRHTGNPPESPGTTARVALKLSYLACEEDSCVPANVNLSLDVPIGAEKPQIDARWAPAFETLDAMQPTRVPSTVVSISQSEVTLRSDASILDPESRDAQLDFFPRESGVVDEGAAPKIARNGDALEIRLLRASSTTNVPASFGGLLVADASGTRKAYELNAATSADTTPSVSTTATSDAAGFDTPPRALPEQRIGAAAAVLFAFLGGLLLNLMPCVFPVLSLKVLAFVERAHGDARGVRSHGWAFTAGVMGSFWLLAGALLVVRAGGAELGWGFQLQSPLFIAVLAYVVFALALSLAGVFELMTSLGGGFAGRAETQSGHAGSFWTGALATVVATPCTAPFMGPALGFALAQPPLLAMSVFTALGAGMATPYIALAYFPQGLRWLPKPGAWMERFRQLMAFPLFATVLWLVSVFEKQAGAPAMMKLLMGLLVVAFALWLWGGGQHAARRSIASAGLAILLAAIGFGLGVGAARSAAPASEADATVANDGFWQPWSPSRVAELRSSGRAVFVNFTAAWCLTCKVNEGAIFARTDVRDVFRRHGVTALEADWTNADPDITRTLAGFGRDGVPLYVFYPAGLEGEPILLPQVPTKQTLETAFGGRG